MSKTQIVTDLTNLIAKAVQPSDFQIATTMVQFADLPLKDKQALHAMIRKQRRL